MTIKDIAIILKNKGNSLIPLQDYQVAAIESLYNVVLPGTYIEFLKLMGGGAGEFMKGSSVFFDDLFNLRQNCKELIEENNLPQLSESAFVYWMHQGYQAAFFEIDGKDDPPVYYFSESGQNTEFCKIENRLTDFFESQLKMIEK
jgi:hypothetical protein